MNVAPDKKSIALRQPLQCGKKSTQKVAGQKRKVSDCRKSKVHSLIAKIRTNFKEAKNVRDALIELRETEKVEEVVGQLSGKEISRLLKSMGKPSYKGKGKAVLIPKLVEL